MKAWAVALVAGGLGALGLGVGYWWGGSARTTASVEPSTPAAASAKPAGKILYYRNPMGLPDTSPVPKKDPMGMDYVPVYEGGEPAADNLVRIGTDRIQRLGVRTEAVAARTLTRPVRAVGTVQADERRVHVVSPKFEGWIQRLHVNTTGQAVRAGEPLMDVYSPELVSAQQEYLIALRGVQAVQQGLPEVQASMRALVEGALQRLRNWDISDEELQRLQTEGEARRYLTLRAPAHGVVLEKPMVQGQRFMAGEMLYRIADLSSVWLLADVFEQDMAMVRPGQSARIEVDAYPGRKFGGRITFIYPVVNAETRTAKVRIELANQEALLKPAMYARAELVTSVGAAPRLAVPDSAVLDTGTRQLVLIDRAEGVFEPRTVRLGMRGEGYSEVLDGVKAGERVVVTANFLIDAESNLKAALAGFGGHAHAAKTAEPAVAPRAAPEKRPPAAPDEHKGH